MAKKVNGYKKVKVQKKEKRKDRTCITRAPMELKINFMCYMPYNI